jgi:hypothetical protein
MFRLLSESNFELGIFIIFAGAFSLISRNKKGRISYLNSEYILTIDKNKIVPSKELFIPKLVVNCKNIVGECPIWDDLRNQLLWIDIEGCKLYLLKMDGSLITVRLPERPGSFALCSSNKRILLSLESGFAFYYFNDSKLERLYCKDYERVKDTRSNDGRCDREGRFVVGGFNPVNEGKDNWERCLPTYSVIYNKKMERIEVKKLDIPLVR